MHLLYNHIRQNLVHFLEGKETSFQVIYTLIQSNEKEKHLQLLRYIHSLLDKVFDEKQNKTQAFHIHFPYELNNDSLSIIAEYLLILFFKESCSSANTTTEKNEKLEILKESLKSKKRKLSTCPSDASGKCGGNRSYKNWVKDKNDVKTLIKFYNGINNDIKIAPNCIFNCQVHMLNSVNNFLSIRPYACNIEDYKTYPTFNIVNTKLTLNQLDEVDNTIIDNLENIILFDCERKKIMQYFSLQDIKDYDINLNKYLILSFSKDNSIHRFSEKLKLIQNRFKITNNTSYTIHQDELDYLLNHNAKKHVPVLFIGVKSSEIWDAFLVETSIQDLYELRSIKLMNIYSLCFDEKIKDFILLDIFSKNYTSDLISDESKQKLLDLRDDDICTLRDSLENVLDLIISSKIKEIIFKKIEKDTLLIVDDSVLKTNKIKNLISSSLLLLKRNKLVSWSEIKSIEEKNVIVLSYQDQGVYPYYFYPNIIEATVSESVDAEAIYQEFLFSVRYEWAKYNIVKNLYELSNHPIRQKHFSWEQLNHSIKTSRPKKKENITWDLEQHYSSNFQRETVKIKLKKDRERTFNCSELFIYSIDSKTYKVDKIEDIIETLEDGDKCLLHHLDEIQENINLYEKMADTSQQEEELSIIRQRFQLFDTETGRLWKHLLKQMTLKTNDESLYEELKNQLESKGLKMVSINHFKNNWLNPESESIAPLNKRVFIELCNYLKLPTTYFILIQRLRNASKQSNRHSTRQMNRLLQDLFNDHCFDYGVNIKKNIETHLEKYKREHPLDELGIDEKYLGENLIALVELLKTEIKVKELEEFKKVE